MLKLAAIALLGAPVVLAAAPASAGQWAVDLGRCPDHLEDIRDRFEDRFDQRVTTSRRDRLEDIRDRRENRRDERITVCPSRSLVFLPGPRGKAKPHRPPERVRLVRQGGRFLRIGRNGRLRPVRVYPPSAAQIERLRREARRDARQERRRDLRRIRSTPYPIYADPYSARRWP